MQIQVFPSVGKKTGVKQWYVRFRNKGRTLLTSEGYKRKRSAVNAAYSVRENAIEPEVELLDLAGRVVGTC